MKISGLGFVNSPIKQRNSSPIKNAKTNIAQQNECKSSLDALASYNRGLISFKSSDVNDENEYLQKYISRYNSLSFLLSQALASRGYYQKELDKFKKIEYIKADIEQVGLIYSKPLFRTGVINFAKVKSPGEVFADSSTFIIRRYNPKGGIDVFESGKYGLEKIVLNRSNPYDPVDYTADKELIIRNGSVLESKTNLKSNSDFVVMSEYIIPNDTNTWISKFYSNYIRIHNGEVFYDYCFEFHDDSPNPDVYWQKPFSAEDFEKAQTKHENDKYQLLFNPGEGEISHNLYGDSI